MAYFANFAMEAKAQELVMARKRGNWLEHILELEKSANARLVKETNFLKEALQEAREKNDHQIVK